LDLTASRAKELDASLHNATRAELKDLAILFGESVDVIRGVETPYEELVKSPFAVDQHEGRPFGTLRLGFQSHRAEYPITDDAHARVLKQLAELGVQEPDAGPSWLVTSTLDNKLVFANLAQLVDVECIGDDTEQMPSFQHPEVYSSLEGMEPDEEPDLSEGFGPLLASKVRDLIGQEAFDDAVHQVSHVRLVSGCGQEQWHFVLDGDATLGFYTLELESYGPMAPNRFLLITSEDTEHERFVNLSHLSLIEMPMNRYLRVNIDPN